MRLENALKKDKTLDHLQQNSAQMSVMMYESFVKPFTITVRKVSTVFLK